jgi:hypothetical protein
VQAVILTKKAKKAKSFEKKRFKVVLHLVHPNSFLRFFFEYLHTIRYHATSRKTIKTDELGINGPIS